MSVAGDGKTLIFVPGYCDVTEAMLRRLHDVRDNKPIADLPQERFRELVDFAERQISAAREIEAEAAEGVPFAVEAYTRRCDEARRAIRTTYDEPLARAGKRLSETNSGNASKSRGIADVAAAIAAVAMLEGGAKELWPRFIAELDARRMEPREGTTPKGDLQVRFVEDRTGRAGTLTLARFGIRLREARKKK